ncbi:hypothetical protein JW979_09075 [bacterium]|nr:hypothetical protein [candidate division CSSED10-310 bacterium]
MNLSAETSIKLHRAAWFTWIAVVLMPPWGILALLSFRHARRLLKEGDPTGAKRAVTRAVDRSVEAYILLLITLIILVIVLPDSRYLQYPPRGYISAGLSGIKAIISGQWDCRKDGEAWSYAASLEELGSDRNPAGVILIDPYLASGEKGGYAFRLIPGPCKDGEIHSFEVQAWPLTQEYGSRPSFYSDESGVIRGMMLDGQPGGAEMPVYDQ